MCKTPTEREKELLITGIKNLLKKINFHELYDNVLLEEISDDEFSEEIDKNPDKYTIEIENLENPNDFLIIRKIMESIGYDVRDLTTSEVSEIFSLNIQQEFQKIVRAV